MPDVSRDLLIQNGRVLDPSQGLDLRADVLVREGRVAAVGPNLTAADAQRFDATGCAVGVRTRNTGG